ncbi:MAG: sugar nucleotide-binding protein [Burkholderiaceae bacterium]|nr:sugar nucleotide-binding protein [Burkholderiaceae bacterium]
MKLLISGASGLLGSALVKLATEQGHTCLSLDRERLRTGDEAALTSLLDGIVHVVHAAANTNVERCETEPQICYRDNVLLTEMLAGAARRRGVPMTFISSTGVYGAHKPEAYLEFDDTRPETHHHKSKLQAEHLVLAADWNNLVIRTGWLFGGSADAAKNFVAKRILEAQTAKEGFIASNQQQRGCPTYVLDLAARLLALITLKARGVFNAVNEGSASRFEYVQEIVGRAGLAVEVRPVAASGFNRIAPVSDNEMAINWRAGELGLPPMRSWQAALADYLASDGMRRMTA